MLWIEFSIYFVLIILLGWRLSVMADKLSDVKNLGKGAVGFILLGFATSLPELITTLTSVLYLDNSSLGAGNIIGSNNANMFILFLSLLTVSSLMRGARVDRESLVSVAIFFITMGIFLVGVSLGGKPEIFGFSPYGYLILGMFFLSIMALKKEGRDNKKEDEDSGELPKDKLGALFYIVLVVVVSGLVAVSYNLSIVVDNIAQIYKWNSTSVGALFLAWATSLPELVVTITAMVIGASEMGIGNILGSNIFNLMVLSLADIFSGRNSKVFDTDPKLLFLSALLIIMTGGLSYMLSTRNNKKIFGITVLPAIMILLYIVGMIFSF
jgi:cation:H+ antiporter